MAQKIDGVIFDFNGTLFWDTPLHNQAWDIFLKRLDMTLSDHEKDAYIHGKPNKLIFEFLMKRSLSPQELDKYIEEKESIYRDICRRANIGFAPGSLDFLEFLKDKGIPYTIATSSGIGNVTFFFEFLQLHKWFKFENVVYDDGSLKGKPDPDIFLEAARRLNVDIGHCALFEDSVAGLQAAVNARAGRLFYVKSNEINISGITPLVITNFNQVDRSIFN